MAASSFQGFNSHRPTNESPAATSQTISASMRVSLGIRSSLEFNSCGLKGFVLASARSRGWAIVREKGERTEEYPPVGESVDAVDDNQVTLSFFFFRSFQILD